MIKKLLKGKNQEAQKQLNELFKDIGDNPKILWYPSAGNDYRHLLELSGDRVKKHEINKSPKLYLHNDINPDIFDNLEKYDEEAVLEANTRVRIINKYELELSYDLTFGNPTIYLLDIAIIENYKKPFNCKVIYFILDNFKFLDQVILKNNLTISHLLIYTDPGGMNTSFSYSFLSAMKTEYLMAESGRAIDENNCEKVNVLKERIKGSPKDYDLKLISNWVTKLEYQVNVFEVIIRDVELSSPKLKNIYELIYNS